MHSQGFTLGYFHIAPMGRDIFIALRSQGFTLGYFHIAPPGQDYEAALFVICEEEAEVAEVVSGGSGDDGVAQGGEHGTGVEVGQ